jgi:hypothetical protein
MARTYIPMAVTLATGLHKRLTRYQAQLQDQATTPEQTSALLDLIACLAEFLANWNKPTPPH